MEKSKILVDSCVWIALYDKNDRQHERAVELFEKIKKDQIQVIVHFLVLVEVLSVLKYKKFDLTILKKIRRQIFETPSIEVFNKGGVDLSPKGWRRFEERNKLGVVDAVLIDYCLKNKVGMESFDEEMQTIYKKFLNKRGY